MTTIKVSMLAVCCSSMLFLSACRDKKDDNTPSPKKPEPTKAKENTPPITKPDTTKPDTAKAEDTKTDAAKPEDTKTDTTKTDTAKPEDVKTDTAKPEETKATVTQPDPAKPTDTKVDTTQPNTKTANKAPNSETKHINVKNSNVKSASNYVSEKAYDKDDILADAQSISVMTYTMPNVQGKTAQATAMVLMPKTPQPKDGWRIVVWEHGTVGVGDHCAPSVNKLNTNFKVLATSLLKAGYVIVAPDYEGLGTPGIHPYMNLGSAAKSAIYAVSAMKSQYGKAYQGNWMSVGQSQGGHASLGTAEYANDDKSYKGAVAAAPVANIVTLITESGPNLLTLVRIMPALKDTAIRGYSDLLTYAAYFTVGLKASDPSFKYKDLFIGNAANLAENAEGGASGDDGKCLAEMRKLFSTDIKIFLAASPNKFVSDYQGLTSNFATNPTIVRYLEENKSGTKKINTPVLIIQGDSDTSVTPDQTDALVEQMKKLGTNVELSTQKGGHTIAIVNGNAVVVEFVQKNMPAK